MGKSMDICIRIGKEVIASPRGSQAVLEASSSIVDDGYSAKDIKILSDMEVIDRFDWAKVGALAAQYNRPAEWIERGLGACAEVGVSPDYFIRRYLDGDKTVPRHDGVDAAFRTLYVEKSKD